MEYLAKWEKKLQHFHKGFFLLMCAEHGLEIWLNRLGVLSNEELKKEPERVRDCYAIKKSVYADGKPIGLRLEMLGDWTLENCYHMVQDASGEYEALNAARERYAKQIEKEQEDELYNRAIYARKAMQRVNDGMYVNLEDYGDSIRNTWQ